jgi:hypothetical protein
MVNGSNIIIYIEFMKLSFQFIIHLQLMTIASQYLRKGNPTWAQHLVPRGNGNTNQAQWDIVLSLAPPIKAWVVFPSVSV